jgi:hypothetical protein
VRETRAAQALDLGLRDVGADAADQMREGLHDQSLATESTLGEVW